VAVFPLNPVRYGRELKIGLAVPAPAAVNLWKGNTDIVLSAESLFSDRLPEIVATYLSAHLLDPKALLFHSDRKILW
jgi:hypothetical protein